MVFEEFYIFGHLIDFFFDFLELRLKTFEVIFKLFHFLTSFFFLNFERDFSFVLVHIISTLQFFVYKDKDSDK